MNERAPAIVHEIQSIAHDFAVHEPGTRLTPMFYELWEALLIAGVEGLYGYVTTEACTDDDLLAAVERREEVNCGALGSGGYPWRVVRGYGRWRIDPNDSDSCRFDWSDEPGLEGYLPMAWAVVQREG